MPYQLGDTFVGNYQITQAFGVNPQDYAKFGLKGHNGLDFGVPTGTQILAAADGVVKEIGNDVSGYGIYIKIIHNGYLTLYGHLQQVVIHLNDKVIAGQLIGLSDNTGNSSGPHLHFGVAPCDANGIKTQPNNGFSGYIDPLSASCQWTIRNLKAPVSPAPAQTAPGSNGDELRALSILYNAYQVLRTEKGDHYGNLEGLVRDLVEMQPKYEAMVRSQQQPVPNTTVQNQGPV